MGVDQAGVTTARDVHPLDPVGNAQVPAHRLDPAVADQDDPVLDGPSATGMTRPPTIASRPVLAVALTRRPFVVPERQVVRSAAVSRRGR